MVIQWRTPTPIEAILRFSTQTPVSDSRRCRGNVVSDEKLDEQLLKPAQIFVQILAAPTQIDDRITHQLTRPVIRRLPAAIDRKKRMRQMRSTRANWIDQACARWYKPVRVREEATDLQNEASSRFFATSSSCNASACANSIRPSQGALRKSIAVEACTGQLMTRQAAVQRNHVVSPSL